MQGLYTTVVCMPVCMRSQGRHYCASCVRGCWLVASTVKKCGIARGCRCVRSINTCQHTCQGAELTMPPPSFFVAVEAACCQAELLLLFKCQRRASQRGDAWIECMLLSVLFSHC